MPNVGANPATGRGYPPAPPRPGAASEKVTFESEGVKLSDAHKGQVRNLAEERDRQRQDGNAPDEAWRGLLDRAQRLFREAAIPLATA